MPNPIDVHIGARLLLRRATLGLTQGQLSKRLDCVEAHVAAMEDGRSRISAAEMFALAKVLRVPVAWFYEDPEN